MKTIRPTKRRHELAGLTDDERARVRTLGARLRGELATLLGKVPRSGPSALSLARDLRVDRNLAQRVLHALEAGEDCHEFLSRLPGVDGLRRLARAAVRRAGLQPSSPAHESSIMVAIDQFEQLVWEVGGSHARFGARCRVTAPASREADASVSSAKASLSGAASALLKYGVELVTHISIVRPMPEHPELIEGCSAFGLIGLTCENVNICVASANSQLRKSAGDLASEVRWTPLGDPLNARDGLLSEFSTSPNVLTASDQGDGFIRQLVDINLVKERGRVDVVIARKWSPDVNPQSTSDPVWSHILRMRHPARRMVFDTYMHASMITRQNPAMGAYLWHPALRDDPRPQWEDRLPANLAPIALPQAPAPAAADAWAKQGELTDRLFEMVGWDRRAFDGFRCDDSAPIWSAAYYMTYDLRRI